MSEAERSSVWTLERSAGVNGFSYSRSRLPVSGPTVGYPCRGQRKSQGLRLRALVSGPSGDAREGSDTPRRREPTDMREAVYSRSARDLVLCERTAGGQPHGACGCGGHALRAGRRVSSANVTSRSAPHTKRTSHETAVYTALHLVLCSASHVHRATARRDGPRRCHAQRRHLHRRERLESRHSSLCQKQVCSQRTCPPALS